MTVSGSSLRRVNSRAAAFLAALLLTVCSVPSYGADSSDNARLQRELIGTTSGLVAATAGGFTPGPIGTAFEITALGLDLTTKALAPKLEVPPSFAVEPNIGGSGATGDARCEYQFEQAVTSGDNEDGDDGVAGGVRDSSSGFMFIPVRPLRQSVWGSLNDHAPELPRVYHPNADVNLTVTNRYLGGSFSQKPRFPAGEHTLEWKAETNMNIPIDVAYGAVTTFWGTGGEARELRKHKLKSISRAWKKNGVKEFSKKFALFLVDFFEVIKFAVSNTGGVVFNPKNPEAWYENTSIVTARNEQSQLLTVYDVTPPYVLDSSSLPVTDSARTQALSLIHI